jgi:hypothetical protein
MQSYRRELQNDGLAAFESELRREHDGCPRTLLRRAADANRTHFHSHRLIFNSAQAKATTTGVIAALSPPRSAQKALLSL